MPDWGMFKVCGHLVSNSFGEIGRVFLHLLVVFLCHMVVVVVRKIFGVFLICVRVYQIFGRVQFCSFVAYHTYR